MLTLKRADKWKSTPYRKKFGIYHIIDKKTKEILTTVKHFISAVSNFRGSMEMTYWRILLLAVMIYSGSRW